MFKIGFKFGERGGEDKCLMWFVNEVQIARALPYRKIVYGLFSRNESKINTKEELHFTCSDLL